jgi:hypothetical protein
MAMLGLASFVPFICNDREDVSVHFYLDKTVEHSDMQEMAQAIPLLLKAPPPLMIEEECAIGYYKMDAGRNCYVFGPGEKDSKVLSHVFVDENMGISAGARELMGGVQAILHKNDGEAAGQDILEFEENLKGF